jgi:uncharacterized protein YyaL (SSP411 family)
MAEYNGRADWRALAEAPFSALQDLFVRQPAAFGSWLQALDFLNGPVRQVALAGDPGAVDRAALSAALWRTYRPRLVCAAGPLSEGGGPLLLADRLPIDGKATAYVCEGFTCRLPVTSPQELEILLQPV